MNGFVAGITFFSATFLFGGVETGQKSFDKRKENVLKRNLP